jgi:RNase P protein component
VKRLLREAFRLEQHRLAPGFDLVVTARAHEDEVPLEECRRLMVQAVRGLETEWERRRRREQTPDSPPEKKEDADQE